MTHSVVTIVVGALLRIIQIIMESSLYVVIGLLTAGALRSMVGPERLRRFFGTGRWTSPIRAWAAATTLLPVCALGVIPVLREFRRAGVHRAAVLTFALAAPMLNPISLVYGMSYLGPQVLVVLIGGAFLVSVGVGTALGYLDSAESSEATVNAPGSVPAVGLRRVAAASVHAANEATGLAFRDIATGILGAALVSSLLTSTYLASSMFAGDSVAVLRMMLVAPLSYVTPDQGVAIVPEMLKFRQSAGAMFVLVALGVGMSLGHVSWIARTYGRRTAAVWLALVLVTTLVVAFAVDRCVPVVGTANEDNDHFGILANAAENYQGFQGLAKGLPTYFEHVGAFRWFTTGALLALMIAGLILRTRGERGRFEAFLVTSEPTETLPDIAKDSAVWNRPLSPRLVSVVGAFCVTAITVAGAYAYFPAPTEAFRDMQIIKADFYGELAATSSSAPLHHLDLWDRQADKLPTGALIRLSGPDAEARRLTSELRQGIRQLRIATAGSHRDEARALFLKVQSVYERCRQAYGIH